MIRKPEIGRWKVRPLYYLKFRFYATIAVEPQKVARCISVYFFNVTSLARLLQIDRTQ